LGEMILLYIPLYEPVNQLPWTETSSQGNISIGTIARYKLSFKQLGN